MSWRDHLLDAKFRNASFKVENTFTEVGRRNVLHQYPFSDIPYVEDLGKDADQFTINGYVIANIANDLDYWGQRDALIAALRERGSGTLTHPFLGEQEVALVGKARLTESFMEGGVARFTMIFVQAEKIEALFSGATVDNLEAVDTAAAEAQGHWYDTFVEIYNTVDAAGHVVMDAIDTAQSYLSMTRSVISAIRNAPAAAISIALGFISSVESTLSQLMSLPCDLANSLVSGMDSFTNLIGLVGETASGEAFGPCSGYLRSRSETDKSSVVNAALAMTDFGRNSDDPDRSAYGGTLTPMAETNTTSAQIQSDNREAIINLVKATAITTAARIAVRIEYESYEDAIEVLNNITEKTDEFLLRLGGANIFGDKDQKKIAADEGYKAMEQLRAVITEAMIDKGASLARVVYYDVPPTVMPSLVLAYDKYNDLDRDSQIMARNRPLAQHPGFLPQGETLELLNE